MLPGDSDSKGESSERLHASSHPLFHAVCLVDAFSAGGPAPRTSGTSQRASTCAFAPTMSRPTALSGWSFGLGLATTSRTSAAIDAAGRGVVACCATHAAGRRMGVSRESAQTGSHGNACMKAILRHSPRGHSAGARGAFWPSADTRRDTLRTRNRIGRKDVRGSFLHFRARMARVR